MKSNIFLFIFSVFLPFLSFAESKDLTIAEAKSKNEKFQKPIVRFLPAMKSCRNSESVTNVSVTGKIMIDYEIDDKGSLRRLKINDEKTTLNDLNIQKCVIDLMKKIKFPKAAKGKIVSISYPVEFK